MPKPRAMKTVGADYLDTAPVHEALIHPMPVSAELAFRALEDPDSWPEFVGAINAVEWTSPKPYGIGTTRTIQGPGGAIEEEFWGWEDGRSMGFWFTASAVPVFAAFAEEWRVEPTGEDTCRLTWRYAFETPRLARPLQPMIAFVFKRQGVASLKTFADYLRANEDRYT